MGMNGAEVDLVGLLLHVTILSSIRKSLGAVPAYQAKRPKYLRGWYHFWFSLLRGPLSKVFYDLFTCFELVFMPR
jgi:hypothetical protein